MGRFLRSCKQQRTPPAAAAPYLTLRSGRRVPAAAAGCPGQCRRRRCGKGSAVDRPGLRRLVLSSLTSLGGRDSEDEEPPPPPSKREDSVVCDADADADESRGVSLIRREMPSSGENSCISRRPSSSPSAAEIEAFFAAAELAERRRFAQAYNYDVALDRPFEGRYEWAPVST